MPHPKTFPRRTLIDVERYLASAVIVGDGVARDVLNRLTRWPRSIFRRAGCVQSKKRASRTSVVAPPGGNLPASSFGFRGGSERAL
jgi:hypothetical protein